MEDRPSRTGALIAQQHEVTFAEPAQQVGDIAAVRAGEPFPGVGVEASARDQQRGVHRRGVQGHLPAVGQGIDSRCASASA